MHALDRAFGNLPAASGGCGYEFAGPNPPKLNTAANLDSHDWNRESCWEATCTCTRSACPSRRQVSYELGKRLLAMMSLGLADAFRSS